MKMEIVLVVLGINILWFCLVNLAFVVVSIKIYGDPGIKVYSEIIKDETSEWQLGPITDLALVNVTKAAD
jgi:hypothetical protein